MEFRYPYILLSSREIVHEEIDFDNEQGVVYQGMPGQHAIWAARVPFLPAMMSEELTRLGVKRIEIIQRRQFRFIYDLVRARENRATFELRFISVPNPIPGQPNSVDIVFFGKVFSKVEGRAEPLAKRLWEKFLSTFPLEDPFGYPIEPVTDAEAFRQFYEPMPFSEFKSENLLEIRKYEDMPIRPTGPVARVERKGDYIAHPFVPSADFNPMSRFFVALASQPQKCFAGISIRPTRMYDQEIYNVSYMIAQFAKTAEPDQHSSEEYIRSRSQIGFYVYNKMMQEREQMVTVRVYLLGQERAPYGLAEAFGSEMMGNVNNAYPTMWAAATPSDEHEAASALKNIRFLEQERWGATIAPPPLMRLRYFATAEEAYGAFRLPVPPESGYMPGVLVRNEPFVAPADELEFHAQANADGGTATVPETARKRVSLGTIWHRGKPTSGEFSISVNDLTRHALIAGSTGSGKSTTIKHVLYQLWVKHRVPFLVLYPLDKMDYRELFGFPELARDLLIFTLGDVRTSPFQFNPFEVPEGLLIKTHLSRLMRVFMAAFTLADPLPMIYRDALRRVYRAKGWDILGGVGDPTREYPIISDFYEAIRQIADNLQYGREVKDNVRQASVIRIADLLENAGQTVNVKRSMDLGKVLNAPAIMELGRVGSAQDTSLLMGFLLMRFAEEVERHPRPADHPHITVVEEAHRLMAASGPEYSSNADSRGAAGEDFSNILAEVRGYGEGIIIAEQIPTLLVKGAFGNTYTKIMHWLEDARSFDEFSSIMNMNAAQREYARSLTPGFAIVRNPYGRPVHVKVPEFGEQPGYEKATQAQSDRQISDLMATRRREQGLELVTSTDYEASLVANASKSDDIPSETRSWFLSIPMQTCAFCSTLLATGKCAHGQRVRNRILAVEKLRQDLQAALLPRLANSAGADQAGIVADLTIGIGKHMEGLARAEVKEIVYCYLAHEVDQILRERRSAEDARLRTEARKLLQNFGRFESPAN